MSEKQKQLYLKNLSPDVLSFRVFLCLYIQVGAKIVADLLERKAIRPYIYKGYHLDQIKEVPLQVETGTTKGKVVVEM
ncbi:MAG: hypothetical protein LBL58_10880 [Tannerellaceae bacterium]|jgi:NADPH:quinone reductase-like Zn-dependent oxidoreductase|nr:hypothetical protein [Tannerellaceae bacterium]